MNAQFLPILLLGVLVLAAGALIISAMARRYRRDLGLGKAKGDKMQDVSFIIGAFQDVTRQLKEKEKELERLKSLAEHRAETVESYTQNILQCVTSGVITFDVQGLVTTVNRSAEEILAIDGERSLGKTCADIFGESDICRLLREALVHELPSRRMETSLVRKGERIWLGFNTALLTDRQGKGLGVILSFSDLTEVKRLQEQMELKERLTALGEMSAGIAHELRNPMAVISGYLTLLAKKQDESGQAIIRDVAAEISGMNRIIGDLLTFARPASLNRVSVNVHDLLETCVASSLQAKGADSRVETVLRLEPVEAAVDEGLMRQAFTNLLQNAVEAMPDGGTLTVAVRADQELSIVIRDTGVGIPRDKIKKIFLPFFTTKDTGVGMGLALAHKIITSHGGRIEVETAEGKGTAFTVTLPLG
jgi:PAS domain S-box-containing protein